MTAARRAVTATFLLNGLLYGSWAARIPAVRDRLDLGAGRLGIALAFVAAGALVSMPVSGWASSRWGSRRTTRGLLAAACVVAPLPALAPALAWLCLGCFALGATNGALDVAMNAHGVAVEREYRRPILSSLHAAFSLGGLLGAVTAAVAAGVALDVRIHLALVGLVAAVIGLPWTRRLLPGRADAHVVGEDGARAALLPQRGSRRGLAALGALAFACLVCEGAAADWSGVYVHHALGASAALGGVAFACFSATMTLGRLTGDVLTARAGAVALVRGGGLVAVVGLGVALAAGTSAAALAGFACLGAGIAVVIPSVFRAAAADGALGAGPAVAIVSTAGYAGFLAGPPIIGAIANATSLRLALGVLPALAFVVALLAGAVRTPAGEARSAEGAEYEPHALAA